MKTELREQSEFIKILKANHFDAYKIKASKRGVPDIEAIKDGVIYKFEVKAVGGVLSPMQLDFFKKYKNTFLVIKTKGVFEITGTTILRTGFKSERVRFTLVKEIK